MITKNLADNLRSFRLTKEHVELLKHLSFESCFNNWTGDEIIPQINNKRPLGMSGTTAYVCELLGYQPDPQRESGYSAEDEAQSLILLAELPLAAKLVLNTVGNTAVYEELERNGFVTFALWPPKRSLQDSIRITMGSDIPAPCSTLVPVRSVQRGYRYIEILPGIQKCRENGISDDTLDDVLELIFTIPTSQLMREKEEAQFLPEIKQALDLILKDPK